MRITQLICLMGLASLLIGCGGKPEPPAIPPGAAAPAVSDSSSPSRTKKSSTASKSRPGTTVNDADLLDWNERLTALRKIQPGMSIEQVEKIIGSADETDDDNDPSGVLAQRGQTLTIATWRGDDPSDDGDFIKIGFINGRLKDRSYINVNAARK